jgi:demethylmenaquinone methyltransferase/2-methoxy-6-polyprenyl-1,4-benzoquinol methylase
VVPEIGRLVVGEAEPYRYLVESIRRFPDRESFAGMMRKSGFSRVAATPLTGGMVALHSGWRL